MSEKAYWPQYNELCLRDKERLYRRATKVVRRLNNRIVIELIPLRTVGVVGDTKSYDPVIFLKPKANYTWQDVFPDTTEDLISTKLGEIVTVLINEVRGIGRGLIEVASSGSP